MSQGRKRSLGDVGGPKTTRWAREDQTLGGSQEPQEREDWAVL